VTVSIYGIKNCDTMKKAFAWLEEHEVAYEFHDYKKNGVDIARLERWARVVGWEALLNKAGTTFRKLPASETGDLDEGKALRLLAAQPSMIKRPVLESGGRVVVGFKAEVYEGLVR
jgi:arsenate reductase (glutaredoxin)